MRTCSIFGCTSGKYNIKVTLFKVSENNKIAWESALHNNINNQLKPLKYICSEHFLPDDVITEYSLPSDVAKVCALKNKAYKFTSI